MPSLLLALVACSSPAIERWGGAAAAGPAGLVDQDQDGWVAGPDCADGDATVHPGASEVCDGGLDNDCDAVTVEISALAAIAGLPDGATALLCPGIPSGSLVLEGRSLTLDGSAGAMIRASDPTRPALTVLGGSVVLDGVHVQGSPYDSYESAPVVEVVGAEIIVRDSLMNYSGGGSVLRATEGSTVRISGSDLTGNFSTTEDSGGALTVTDGWLEVEDSSFVGNLSVYDGAAIRLERTTATLVGVSLSTNNAMSGSGGAIYAVASTLTLSDVEALANYAGGAGGAVYAESTDLIAQDCLLDANTAADGGGMWLAGSTAYLAEVTISDNTALSGGGLHAQASTVDGDFVTLSTNLASAWEPDSGGGALHLTAGTNVTARAWSIDNNTSYTDGGGMLIESSSFDGDAATVASRNVAYDNGGGVMLTEPGASFAAGAIRECGATLGGGMYAATFGEAVTVDAAVEDNYADQGGGLYVAAGHVALAGGSSGNLSFTPGGGVWLAAGASVAGEVDWGVGPDRNTPDDLASRSLQEDLGGLVYVDCTDQGCAAP